MNPIINVTRFRLGKHGLTCNPIGAHVMTTDRSLLGEVVDAFRDPVTNVIRLRVKHFDGSPWPIEPRATAIDVLIRDYHTIEE